MLAYELDLPLYLHLKPEPIDLYNDNIYIPSHMTKVTVKLKARVLRNRTPNAENYNLGDSVAVLTLCVGDAKDETTILETHGHFIKTIEIDDVSPGEIQNISFNIQGDKNYLFEISDLEVRVI